MAKTITWDGVTNGRDHIDTNQFVSGITDFYKVSDEVLTKQDFEGSSMIYSNGTEATLEIETEFTGNVVVTGSRVISGKAGTHYGNNNTYYLTLPSDGTYFAAFYNNTDNRTYVASATFPNVEDTPAIPPVSADLYIKKGNKVYKASGGGSTGVNIITANSKEELPDPSTVAEGTIALVPSGESEESEESGDNSGLGLPVVELTTNIAVAASDNSSTETTLSEAEGEALYAAGGLGLPVIIKWSSDIFPFFSIASHCGALQFELNNIMSASDGTSFTFGMIYKISGAWKFLTWKKSF